MSIRVSPSFVARIAPLLLVLAGILPSPAAAQERIDPIEIAEAPNRVTIYVGRAAVTRSVRRELRPGLHALRFVGLPERVQPDSLQTRTVGPARVVGVEYEERRGMQAADPRVRDLDQRIDQQRRLVRALEGRASLLAARERFLDAFTIRATGDGTADAGTERLDLDAIRAQLAFVGEERATLVADTQALDVELADARTRLEVLESDRAAIADDAVVHRSALVTLAVTAAAQVDLDLTYLVTEATWLPVYNVRAAPDGSSVSIEYDALITQRCGEDWIDAATVLSTAQPTLAANPPALDPWFVDIRSPDRAVPTLGAPVAADAEFRRRASDEKSMAEFAGDAAVGGAGPSVTYTLPRPVTARSSTARRQRTRIATIDAEADFVHVAVPILTDGVYIRGALTNASAYQLLSGAVSIFVGPDFVGPTTISPVAPRGTFELYFGIDAAVTARRVLVTKETEKTGLLGGGRRTAYEYRVEIDNGTGKAIRLELRDRRPVSLSDQVEVEVVDLSLPLAADAAYVETELPRGILKWILSVPPDARGATPVAVTWGVRVSHGKDLELTPLPE